MKTLILNEKKVLNLLQQQVIECTGDEFGYMDYFYYLLAFIFIIGIGIFAYSKINAPWGSDEDEILDR